MPSPPPVLCPRLTGGMGKVMLSVLAGTGQHRAVRVPMQALNGTWHPAAGQRAGTHSSTGASHSHTSFRQRLQRQGWPHNPMAVLKYSGGKAPTVPRAAFYLNNILSWMTSLCNAV